VAREEAAKAEGARAAVTVAAATREVARAAATVAATTG